MTTQVVDEKVEVLECFYCSNIESDDNNIMVSTVSVTTVRCSTFDEAASQYRWSKYGSPDFHTPFTEADMIAIQSRMVGTWKFGIADRYICSECVRCCDWCEDLYAPAHAKDNTYDNYEGSRLDPVSRLWWSHAETLCRSCADDAWTCDRCDGLTHPDYAHHLSDELTYCQRCYENYSEYCDACRGTYSEGHGDDCESLPVRVRNYSYKPDPEFAWIEEVDGDVASDNRTLMSTPFLGFELEIECSGSINEALDIADESFDGHAYYKEDGSIEYGFEIVTHPMTLEAHKRLINWSFASRLAKIGCRSWNTSTCGLHVHISRSAFRGATHIAMFQHLIINNDVEMSRLAGRSSDRWASFHGVRQDIQKRLKGQAHPQRYEAVNTTPEDTIEVRMFRGSLKAERVMMALELVDAAFHYTKRMGTNDYIRTDRAHFYHFAQWVSGNEKYQNLNYYINEYNLTANLPASLAQVESN